MRVSVSSAIRIFTDQTPRRFPGASKWLGMGLAAFFPSLPHVGLPAMGRDLAALTVLISYIPLMVVLTRSPRQIQNRTIFWLGFLHGTFLALIAASWVWTFERITIGVPLAVGAFAGLLYGFVFIVARSAATCVERRLKGGELKLLQCQRRCKTRPLGGVKPGQVAVTGAMARALTIELARAMAHWPLGAKSRRSDLRTFVAAFGQCCWRGDNSRRSFRGC